MTTAEFNQLSKKQQVIAIAKDVIKQVKAGTYKTKTGTYVKIPGKYLRDVSSADQLQPLIPEIKCEVCARGALFMSKVNLGDQCKLRELQYDSYNDVRSGSSHMINEHITSIFGEVQEALIELAFEGAFITGVLGEKLDPGLHYGVLKLGKAYKRKYPRATDRIIAIMKNIIRNKGVFILR